MRVVILLENQTPENLIFTYDNKEYPLGDGMSGSTRAVNGGQTLTAALASSPKEIKASVQIGNTPCMAICADFGGQYRIILKDV